MAEDAGRCMEMELKVQLVKLPKKVGDAEHGPGCLGIQLAFCHEALPAASLSLAVVSSS